MTEEEYFIKTYPDSCYGDKPLSPYFDFFQDGVEFGERESEEKIAELEESLEKLQKSTFNMIDEKNNRITDLEQENTELKTKKIPQLERRIASIRGSHSVDAKKLNARTEQIERLKKEVLEVRQHLDLTEREWGKDLDKQIHFKTQSTKAKEIIREFVEWATWQGSNCPNFKSIQDKAEQFLSEVEK